MSAPVAELFAELGFKVDTNSLGQADKGLTAITALAERAVLAIEGLTGAFAQLGLTAKASASSAEAASAVGAIAESCAIAAHGPHATVAPHGAPKSGGGHGGGHGPEGLTGYIEKANHVTHGFLALFAGHEVLHFAHELMELGSHTELTAKKLGLTAEKVQSLQYAAKLTDVAAGSLNTGLKFLQISATKAASGAKEPAEAFKKLGISAKELTGVPLDELFETVATKMQALGDPAKQTTLAVQLFGRSGAELVPLLQEGGEGIKKFREEAEALGGGLTETLLEHSAEYEHAIKRFEFAFLGVKSAIGNVLLPVLTRLTQGLTWLVGKFNELEKKTKLLQTILGVGLVLTLAKIVLWMNAVGSAGVLAWLKSVGGFILLAAVIAGVTLVLEDLYQTLTGGKGMIGKWLDEWQGIGTTAEFVKNLAAGIDSVRVAVEKLVKSPLKTIKELFQEAGDYFGLRPEYYKDKNGQWQMKQGKSLRSQLDASAEERANRPIANGRGSEASARSNIDLPRATGRGTLAGSDVAFGQAKGSAFSAGTANGDSITVHVHAKTDASPHEIGHHVKRAIEEHQAKRTRKLHHALVPRVE